MDRAKIVLAASEMITKIQAEAKERQQAALEKANAERKALADAKKVVEKNPELAEQFIRNETEPVCHSEKRNNRLQMVAPSKRLPLWVRWEQP